MKKITVNIKKIATAAALLVLAAALCLSLCGCLFIATPDFDLSGDSSDGSFSEWIGSLTGDNGSGTVNSDGDGSDSGSGAAEFVSGDVNTITIETDGADEIQYSVAKGLMSTVSIVANFTIETTTGGWFGGRTTTEEVSSGGTGVIINIDKELGNALILTNYHVVFDVDSITSNLISDDICVYLYGSESYLTDEDDPLAIPAKYLGGSMNYDLAVLYVENSNIIRRSFAEAVTIADSNSVRVGQSVFTIGNQKGYGIAVTRGVISKESQTITMTAVDEVSTITLRVIRVDAAINPGSSGGGLFNEAGELIGIVNAKNVETNVDSIGYAIPSNIASAIANSIINYCSNGSTEHPMRALLGIVVAADDSLAVFNTDTGLIDIVETVVVESVNSDSLASGKLQAGDVIKSLMLNGDTIEVTRTFHIVDFMLNARAGDKVIVTIERGGKEMKVEFTITTDCLTTLA